MGWILLFTTNSKTTDICWELDDELDSDIKLEEEEEEPIIIPIESSEIVGVQICEVCSKFIDPSMNMIKVFLTMSGGIFIFILLSIVLMQFLEIFPSGEFV